VIKIIEWLKVYACCFAWDYTEMPGLSRELVEHQLPIKAIFRLYKHGARNFKPEIIIRVKEEVDWLLQAGFIQPCCYEDWVSNIVPVEMKNTGKILICVDFRKLNRATPKDRYPMPVANLLVNSASGNKVISFLDGNAGYNQIFMVKEDVSKTVFHCPGFIGLFDWVVMTFRLNKAGATYQKDMDLIFYDLLRVLMEVYIDDVVVKSVRFGEHMTDLKLSLERMKKYGLWMNPLKCTFGVTLGRFLGFIVHEHGIQSNPKKIESNRKVGEPVCKKDVQKLFGMINYLHHFISILAGRVEPLLPLLWLKLEEEFTWGAKQQEAFEKIKEYLVSPLVLRAPKAGNPFKMYITAQELVIGAVLLQEEDGKESPVAYVSRRLLDAETRCVSMEKLCLSLYYACSKFRHYILSRSYTVACQYDVMKHVLLKPILSGRIVKWAYVLVEYDLANEPLRLMKGK
jgi:hypothetical protein